MATKHYLHAESYNTSGGTFPSGEQDSQAADFTATGANTLKLLSSAIGTAQATQSGATSATTSNQAGFMGFWATAPLDSNQTVGGGIETITVNIAESESNLSANFCINKCHAYVWRPSTGAVVGDLCTYASIVVGTPLEPTSASSEQVTTFSVILASVSALTGDVIIVELWADFTQGSATSYTASLYYDGTTENTVENTVVSNHASFVEFSQNFTFTAPGVSLTQNEAITIFESTADSQAFVTQTEAITIFESTAVSQAFITQMQAIVLYIPQAASRRHNIIIAT